MASQADRFGTLGSGDDDVASAMVTSSETSDVSSGSILSQSLEAAVEQSAELTSSVNDTTDAAHVGYAATRGAAVPEIPPRPDLTTRGAAVHEPPRQPMKPVNVTHFRTSLGRHGRERRPACNERVRGSRRSRSTSARRSRSTSAPRARSPGGDDPPSESDLATGSATPAPTRRRWR